MLMASILQKRPPCLKTTSHLLTREDDDALHEQRFVTLGMSGVGSLLVVVYTYREPDIVRLISALEGQ
jgi:uncharacterized DUF497 family protein